MADQIFAAGPLPAPLKYNVPGSQRMIPRACQALFDGSGASGDFIPTLIFRSQAGHVISRAILGSTVAAGASAEVSWFPSVGGGGSSLDIHGAQAGMWLLSTDTPYTVAALSTDQITFPNANYIDPPLIADSANGQFDVNVRGMYWASAAVLWEAADFPRSIWINAPKDLHLGFLPAYTDSHVLNPAGAFTAHDPTGLGELWCRDTALFSPNSFSSLPDTIQLNVHNGDVVDRNVVQAFYACFAVYGKDS